MNVPLNAVLAADPDAVDNATSFLSAHGLSLLGVVVGIVVVIFGLFGKHKKAMIVAGVAMVGMMMILDPAFLPTVFTALAKKAANGS